MPYIKLIYDADMPAKSGLGTSSSFTVSLIKSIHKYKNKKINKTLLKKSIFRKRIFENLLDAKIKRLLFWWI